MRLAAHTPCYGGVCMASAGIYLLHRLAPLELVAVAPGFDVLVIFNAHRPPRLLCTPPPSRRQHDPIASLCHHLASEINAATDCFGSTSPRLFIGQLDLVLFLLLPAAAHSFATPSRRSWCRHLLSRVAAPTSRSFPRMEGLVASCGRR